MAKCPKCDADVPIKFSNRLKCPACNSDLVIGFSPLGKAITLLVILVESVASIVVSVIAGSINYPFLQKWTVAGAILFGLIVISLLLLFGILKKLGSFRLKGSANN